MEDGLKIEARLDRAVDDPLRVCPVRNNARPDRRGTVGEGDFFGRVEPLVNCNGQYLECDRIGGNTYGLSSPWQALLPTP